MTSIETVLFICWFVRHETGAVFAPFFKKKKLLVFQSHYFIHWRAQKTNPKCPERLLCVCKIEMIRYVKNRSDQRKTANTLNPFGLVCIDHWFVILKEMTWNTITFNRWCRLFQKKEEKNAKKENFGQKTYLHEYENRFHCLLTEYVGMLLVPPFSAVMFILVYCVQVVAVYATYKYGKLNEFVCDWVMVSKHQFFIFIYMGGIWDDWTKY